MAVGQSHRWRMVATYNGMFIRRNAPGRRLRPNEFMHWHNEVEQLTIDKITKGAPAEMAAEHARAEMAKLLPW